LSKTNKNVEWIVYSDEGHGFHQAGHQIDYWEHVEALLDRCLHPPPERLTSDHPSDRALPAASR